MFDKLEDNPSSQERLKEPIPNKLGSKSPTFLQRFIQKKNRAIKAGDLFVPPMKLT